MEDMAVKACKLMTIFELDEEEFSNDLQQNMRALGEFQQ